MILGNDCEEYLDRLQRRREDEKNRYRADGDNFP
jgi:hypothetical protein